MTNPFQRMATCDECSLEKVRGERCKHCGCFEDEPEFYGRGPSREREYPLDDPEEEGGDFN